MVRLLFMLKEFGLNGVLNKQDKDGNKPLHLAAISKDFKILNVILIDETMDRNAVMKDGLTAMDIILSCKELGESPKV